MDVINGDDVNAMEMIIAMGKFNLNALYDGRRLRRRLTDRQKEYANASNCYFCFNHRRKQRRRDDGDCNDFY